MESPERPVQVERRVWPIRIGLVIYIGDPEHVHRAVEIATSQWGGLLFPLIPNFPAPAVVAIDLAACSHGDLSGMCGWCCCHVRSTCPSSPDVHSATAAQAATSVEAVAAGFPLEASANACGPCGAGRVQAV